MSRHHTLCVIFENVFVGVDDPESGRDALERARRLASRYAECVEVTGSQVGLVFNRKSYRAVAQALAAPELPAHSDPRVSAGRE